MFLAKSFLVIISLLLANISFAQLLSGTEHEVSKQDPYCGTNDIAGYNQKVLGVSAAEDCTPLNVTDIPENVVDWVLIELRAIDKPSDDNINADNATIETVISRKPAFVLTSGLVLDAERYSNIAGTDSNKTCTATEINETTVANENCPPVEFSDIDEDVTNKDLYTVVRHINHLDIISKTAATTLTDIYRYKHDLTKEDSARGGAHALKRIGDDDNAAAVMYVGDVNGDMNINAADYLEIYSDMFLPAADHRRESDINFSGDVDTDDTIHPPLLDNLGRTSHLP